MAFSYRKSTLRFTFNNDFARPKAYEVERFIRDVVKIEPDVLVGIHLSIVSSVVYCKLIDEAACDRIIQRHQQGLRFCHSDGNVGAVTVDHAGMGIRTIRVFELPFELPEKLVTEALSPYGTVISHEAEKWASFETYRVLNGVRQVKIDLRKHVPSYLYIGGCRAIVIYDGQPRTCSGCGKEGHVRSECTQRRLLQLPRDDPQHPQQTTVLPLTYAAAFREEVRTTPEPNQQAPSEDHRNESRTEEVEMDHDQRSQDELPSTQPTPLLNVAAMDVDSVKEQERELKNENQEATPTSDSERRQRKQRSPKRQKKRRLSSEKGSQESDTNDEVTHSLERRPKDTEELPNEDARERSGAPTCSPRNDATEEGEKNEQVSMNVEDAQRTMECGTDGSHVDWSAEVPQCTHDDDEGATNKNPGGERPECHLE